MSPAILIVWPNVVVTFSSNVTGIAVQEVGGVEVGVPPPDPKTKRQKLV